VADSDELLRRVARGETDPGGFHWGRIMQAMHEIASGPPPADRTDRERLLLELLDREGPVALQPDSPLPHAMPPEHMLRTFAMQVLAKWDLDKHRDKIQALATSPRVPERVAAVARGLVSPDQSSATEG